MSPLFNAFAVKIAFCWLTSTMALSELKFKNFYGAPKTLIGGSELTLRARSKTHCAIQCRQYPHCISFAYDREPSTCLLHPGISEAGVQGQAIATEELVVYTDSDPDCQEAALNFSNSVSTTTRRSVWLVDGNVKCHDDYYPPQITVTCSKGGYWTSLNPSCVQRVWRYPETKKDVALKIPPPVTEGFSLCGEGVPTYPNRFDLEIFGANGVQVPVHTEWRFRNQQALQYLAINDVIETSWGPETEISVGDLSLRPQVGQPFSFRLSVNSSTSVSIYVNGQFIYTHQLRLPLSSFYALRSKIDVNVTKVEAWCRP